MRSRAVRGSTIEAHTRNNMLFSCLVKGGFCGFYRTILLLPVFYLCSVV
jgi:hypothetical protein